ncbi:MAG TPA: ATPase [Prolixibacteraceae bacterium]|nr:ATPase [Prolixibacteraceae bacterium]
MILVAESGSTKTQWCAVYPDRIENLHNTAGINPLLLTIDEIETIIRPVLAGIEISDVESVYYFGAGCGTIAMKEKIGKALFLVFEAPEIVVDTDLIAACLALAGDKPAMVGLLGTGSNSCLWNGATIEYKTPSLGFILGDEGGGVSLGKQLVSDFLQNQMPLNLRVKFIEKYDVSVETVLERVYQMQMPNRYLAGFAPFIESFIDDPYCQSLLNDQFDRYLKRNILQYKNATAYDLHFCGSIAYVHRDHLTAVCRKYNLTIGKIVKEPLDDLARFLKDKLYG